MNDWPRMLYRKGGPLNLHGFDVEITIVENAEEEDAATPKGWRRTPAEADAVDTPDPVREERAGRIAAERELEATKEAFAPFDPDGNGKPGGKRQKLSVKAGK